MIVRRWKYLLKKGTRNINIILLYTCAQVCRSSVNTKAFVKRVVISVYGDIYFTGACFTDLDKQIIRAVNSTRFD